MNKLLILLLALSSLAWPQAVNRGNAIKFQGRNFASTAPTNTQVICWDSAGSGTWKPCTGATGGNMLLTSGSIDPSGACVAGIAQYLQTTTLDEWFCAVSGTWKKKLSTTNTGTFSNVGLNGTVPATPATGYVTEYYDSTAKLPQSVDDAGAKGTMVRPITAITSQWIRSISSLGVFTLSQPAESDLAFTDITTGNVSTTKHGYAPKAPNDATKFLDGTGAYSTPATGAAGPSVAWGYDGGTTVTTTATTLCSMSVPANSLGLGGAASSKTLTIRFMLYNNTGTGNLSFALNYGTSSFTIAPVIGTNNAQMLYASYAMANDLGRTDAQSITVTNYGSSVGGGLNFTDVPMEPNQNSATTLTFALKATAASTSQQVRVFMCSIALI